MSFSKVINKNVCRFPFPCRDLNIIQIVKTELQNRPQTCCNKRFLLVKQFSISIDTDCIELGEVCVRITKVHVH